MGTTTAHSLLDEKHVPQQQHRRRHMPTASHRSVVVTLFLGMICFFATVTDAFVLDRRDILATPATTIAAASTIPRMLRRLESSSSADPTHPPCLFRSTRRGIAPVVSLLAAAAKDSNDSDSGGDVSPSFVQTDPVLRDTAKTLRRVSWFSWWSQVILTCVSGVILLFAKSVMSNHRNSSDGPSFFLSGAGILLNAVSIVWTWGNGARLSRRLTVKPVSCVTAATMLRRAIQVGVMVNLAGLLCNLLAAEEIIGSLAIKVLTNRNALVAGNLAMGAAADAGLQPLDVLVVQANTNSLLSQFSSLVSLLSLTSKVKLLDPPSTEDKPRKSRK